MPTPLHVLILEDSPTDADVMLGHLREAGYSPEWRRVETEADYLAHLEPALDLILIDSTLPAFHGRRALEILRERGLDIPAIIVTGTISEEAALDLLRLGAADYLLKDRLERLGTAARNAFAQRVLRRERAAAEAASQASEARARLLAEVMGKSSQAFGIAYPDGRLGIRNAAACALLGYTEAELQALDWSRDLTPPEWRTVDAERLAELERTGQPVRYEKELLRKDGSRVPVELLVHLARDSNDSPPYYYAFITDLTARKRAEEALRESEEWYRSLFQNSLDAILLTSPDGRILAANPEACRIFGQSEEEICQAGRAGLVDPADPRLPALLEERARTGKAKGELTFIRKDGSKFPGEISSAAFKDRDGLLKTSMTIRDVTARKHAEDALVRERDYSRTLVDGANAIVVGLDPEGRIALWNQAAERLSGYAWADLLGKDWFEVLVPRTRYPQVREEFRRLTEGGLPGEFENPILTKSGEERIIAWRNSHVREGDTITGIISFGIDVTEQKRAGQALQERTRQLEAVREVATEIARELNLTALLQLILQRAMQLVGSSGGAVRLWDEASGVLTAGAWHGVPDAMMRQARRLGEGVGGTAAQLREGLIVNDFRTSPYATPFHLQETAYTAMLAEPMFYRDGLVGVITLDNGDTKRPFTETDQVTLRLFASQAAIAIENARLYEAERERRRELEAIRAVTVEITRELDLTSLLGLIVKRATELLEVSGGSVFLWDEEAGTLTLRAWHGYGDWIENMTLSLGGGVAGQAAERRKGMIVNDYRASPHALPMLLERTTITGALAEPLLYRDRLLGVIVADNMGTRRPFTGHDQELLALFAAQAAVGIENARLHESALLRAQQLVILNELTRTLALTLNPAAVAREILGAVQILMPGTVGQLWELVSGVEVFRLLAVVGTQMPEPPFRMELPAGQGLAGLAGSSRQYATSPDVTQDPRFANVAWAKSEGLVSCIVLPLVHQEQVHGTLVILTRTPHTFSEQEINLLQAFAAHAAIALENATLFQMISERRAEVRALAARLAEAEEDERKRLARELHDQVGQNLTALGINLNILRGQVGATVGPEIQSRLEDSFRLVDQTTERIRDVMGELRPPVLDDYGLVAALRWYAEDFSARTQIVAEVQGEEPVPRLKPLAEIALFRIAQEALTNVAKHAAVTRVRVGVDTAGTVVRLVIADDGVGFDPSHQNGRMRWGLMTMSERATAVGGHCAIDSQPGKGTWVVVEVPR